uniref:Protein phosphatase inhibitor family protein n=1 Tax=Babesia bovis TaxID=5865 RepID=S6BKW3_BABBO|nr:protein phosphatase inhibitor family protein [Babesia bovis]
MSGSTTSTVVVSSANNSPTEQRPPRVVEANLRVLRPAESRQVTWEEGTVDNEHLHRKSSKSCCIFTKRKQYNESSDDEDDNHSCSARDNKFHDP